MRVRAILIISVIAMILGLSGCSIVAGGKFAHEAVGSEQSADGNSKEPYRSCKLYGEWISNETEEDKIYNFGDGVMTMPDSKEYLYRIDSIGNTDIIIISNENNQDWLRYEAKSDGENIRLNSYDLISGAETAFTLQSLEVKN